MNKEIVSKKQRLILDGLIKACAQYDHTQNCGHHFDEAVRIQSEIGHPYLRSKRYEKTRDITELLDDKPKCHGPNDLVKITIQSIDERHDFIFLMLDVYSKFEHTYSEETSSDLQGHILDVSREAGWQYNLFIQNHFSK